MFASRLGYNPTANQAEFGSPAQSDYGNTVAGADKQAKTLVLVGFQFFKGWAGTQHTQPANYIPLPTSHTYRGILPMALIPQMPVPFPYELGVSGGSVNGFA